MIDERKTIDSLVRSLWIALNDMSNYDNTGLTDADLSLWTAVTEHPAIQNRLEKTRKAEALIDLLRKP